jgi:hypothetical protein
MELGRVSTNATGYFADTNVWPAYYLDHGQFGAGIWLPQLQIENSFIDFAYSGSCDPPWTNGSFSWSVPVIWHVGTTANTESCPITWNQDQEFSIDGSGTVTIRKFEHSVTRTTSDAITTQ